LKKLQEEKMEYLVSGQRYIGILLKASSEEPKAAVVLLPDWRGQSKLAYEHANHLIDLGYTVVIADLYGDGFTPNSPTEVGPLVKQLIEQRVESVQILVACTKQLKTIISSNTPIFHLGFSAGGMIALDYGRMGADSAGIILCSALLKTALPKMNQHIHAPILILQGTQDEVSPMHTILEIIEEMDKVENDTNIHLYSQTHHAFDNPEAGTDPKARLVYSKKSAQRAKNDIENFINNSLPKA